MTDIHTPHDFENRYSPAQLRAIRAEYAPKATDAQWLLFISECVRRNLTPGDHVVFQVRRQNVFDESLNQWVKESRGILITTLKALRLLAKRSGNYEGPRRFKYYYLDANGDPTTITEIPLGRIPHAVSIEGFVKGWREPAFGVARYDACVQRKKDGQPNSVWSQRGEEQTAKCAEAFMLRQGFPEELGGLYIEEEMPVDPDTMSASVSASPTPSPAVEIPPQPIEVPLVNNAPASTYVPNLPGNTSGSTSVTAGPISGLLVIEPYRVSDTKAVAPTDEQAAAQAVLDIHAGKLNPTEPDTQRAAAEIAKQTHTEHAAPKPAGPPKAQMPSLLDFVESCDPTDTEMAANKAAYEAEKTVQRPAAPVPAEVTIPGQERLGTVPAPDPAFLDSIPDKARKEVYVHRCTNLTRDVLPKAGAKNAGALLLAFLLKDTGKPTWNELTIREWNTALEKIEAVKTPQAILKLLQGR